VFSAEGGEFVGHGLHGFSHPRRHHMQRRRVVFSHPNSFLGVWASLPRLTAPLGLVRAAPFCLKKNGRSQWPARLVSPKGRYLRSQSSMAGRGEKIENDLFVSFFHFFSRPRFGVRAGPFLSVRRANSAQKSERVLAATAASAIVSSSRWLSIAKVAWAGSRPPLPIFRNSRRTSVSEN
jgi:hypothetical protein